MSSYTFLNFIPGHGPNEYIVLPRQSLLGKFEGLDDRPTGVWPIKLLCLLHGHVFERSADTVEFGPVPATDRTTQPMPLWLIECTCAHGNCGRKMRIFGYGDGSETEDRIRWLLIRANPALACLDHQFLLDAAMVTIERLC
jgi:hypothetical protein